MKKADLQESAPEGAQRGLWQLPHYLGHFHFQGLSF